MPKIETPMGEKSDAHILFNLTTENDGQLPMKQYIELDVNFMRLKVLNVGFLFIDEPNKVLDKKHHTKLPGIFCWNMMQLMYKVFMNKYGVENLTPFNVQ